MQKYRNISNGPPGRAGILEQGTESMLATLFRPNQMIGRWLVIVFVLAPLGAVEAEVARPAGVASSAQYLEAARVWVLEAGGQQTVWYQDGTKKAEGSMANGQRQGSWVFYYANGNKKAEGAYQANLRQGHWKNYTATGRLLSEGDYRNNLREGEWVFYYPGGQVETRGHFQSGQRHGAWINYYETGQIFYQGQYANGKASGAWVYYYAGGQLYQRGTFQNDVRVGAWNICIQPNGPCGTETYEVVRVPPLANIAPSGSTIRTPTNTSDPGAILDALENGGVPDDVPASLNNGW